MQELKQTLYNGGQAIGSWVLTSSADNTEILAQAGLDFIIIDHEHGQGSLSEAVAQLRGLSGTRCAGLLRVPSNDPVYIKRALDIGVAGILVPNVNSAAEAEQAVRACRYPGAGIRGVFSGMRAMQYGRDKTYHQTADSRALIMVQVETPQAIDAIPAIADVEGVDLIFIGPRDLSASLGRINQFQDPVVRRHIDRARDAILQSGRLMGSIAGAGMSAGEMFDLGFDLVVSGSDATLLTAGAQAVLDQVGDRRRQHAVRIPAEVA